MKALDLAGQRYNRITVIERDYEYPKSHNYATSRSWWKCQCDCGKFFTAAGTKIKNGIVKSCGCLASVDKIRDIKGQRFGKLVAIELTDKRDNYRNVIWKCLCDCGNITYQSVNHLVSEDGVKSCGCVVSKGENKISQLLTINNIPFKKQKTYPNCYLNDHSLLRFDFYINDKFLLEFDGSQHFYYSNKGWNDKEHFILTKKRDYEKNKWALENKIELKRIPFWKFSTLCLDDIMNNNFIIDEKILKKDLWLINNSKSWAELKEEYSLKNAKDCEKWYSLI